VGRGAPDAGPMETTRIRSGSVVVGYDGSTGSDRALAWAAEQAALEHRPLVVVHAAHADDTRAAVVLGAGVLPVPARDLVRRAQDVADHGVDLALAHHPGLEIVARPVLADVRHELVGLSESAAMVVVGSRGHGRVASGLLSSVGAHLARNAACVVAVCRPGNPALVHGGVAVAADATEGSRPVLEHAFRLASLRRLPLTVVHAVPADEGLDEARRALAEAVAGFAEKFPDVYVDQRLSSGPIDVALRAPRPWHLVVVGRHPLDSRTRRFTHVTATRVLEHSDATVVVVPQRRQAAVQPR
jgi:nucleotide-binding universal stress UspA family protein